MSPKPSKPARPAFGSKAAGFQCRRGGCGAPRRSQPCPRHRCRSGSPRGRPRCGQECIDFAQKRKSVVPNAGVVAVIMTAPPSASAAAVAVESSAAGAGTRAFGTAEEAEAASTGVSGEVPAGAGQAVCAGTVEVGRKTMLGAAAALGLHGVRRACANEIAGSERAIQVILSGFQGACGSSRDAVQQRNSTEGGEGAAEGRPARPGQEAWAMPLAPRRM